MEYLIGRLYRILHIVACDSDGSKIKRRDPVDGDVEVASSGTFFEGGSTPHKR